MHNESDAEYYMNALFLIFINYDTHLSEQNLFLIDPQWPEP